MDKLLVFTLVSTLAALPAQASQPLLPPEVVEAHMVATQVVPPSTENYETLAPLWHLENPVVAHALGQIEGRYETNSREAFLHSYDQGIRVFEADFQLTSDGILVVRHDFEQISYYNLEQVVYNKDTSMTYDRYINEKINFKYTPLTGESLLQLLVEHPDAYLITDTKHTDSPTLTSQFTQLVQIAQKLGEPQVLDRIVVQIYNPEMYHQVGEIYPFDQWIYTLYQQENPDYHQVGQFCRENAIDVVTLSEERVSQERMDILDRYGLKVYAHTVNRLQKSNSLLEMGVDGVYSDVLTLEDWALISPKSQ